MANSQRILNAQIENAQAQLGTMFLPIVTKVMGFLNTQGIPILQNLIKEFQTFAGPILAQAGAMFEAFQASMSGAQTPFEGLQKVLDVFGGWWKINGPFIIPVVRQIGEAMNKAFTAIGKQVLPALQSAFQKVSVWFYQNGPLINKVIKTIGDVITNNILPALVAFGGVIGPLFEGIVNIVMGAVQLIMQLIAGDWTGAWATAGQIFADFATAIRGALTGLFATILALFGTSLTKIKVIWAANWNALKQIITTVTNMIMTTIINWLRSIITSIIGFAVNLYTAWKSAWDTLINAVIEATAGIIVAVINMVASVIAAIQAQIVNFLAIGAAIVKAIQDGITNAWNAFLAWLIDLVKGLITSILALFGIGGEGADAMESAGYGMMVGLARGILQGAGLPRMALATVSLNMGGMGGGGAYNSTGGMRTGNTYQRNNIYGPVTLQMNGGRGTELLKIK
jgi:phage-related protein